MINNGISGGGLKVVVENNREIKDIFSYVKKYKSIPGKKLITHETIAIHTGDIVGFDWFLLSHLQDKGLIKLDTIFYNISKGKYSMVVLNQGIITELEWNMYQAVKNGPYVLTYYDNIVSEWVCQKSEAKE
ncbi:MAG: hypothetical protein QME42_02565 [bacterium]|nr:hypothetical protein [bacterium]